MKRNFSNFSYEGGIRELVHRSGTVLDSSTLIKVDKYSNKKKQLSNFFPRRVSGADQLRVMDGTFIIGVAQPTLAGVRGILDFLNAGRLLPMTLDPSQANRRKVLWINLREEPLLYLNGRPVVLREVREPFRNMDTFKGISEARLRDIEWRFKEDVIAEGQRCGGSVLLHEEEEANQLVEKWESAPPSAVLTAEEVFFQLRQEGYRVKYERITCTSGQAPPLSFFDELVRTLTNLTDRETWIVFNCQSGNARSTVAMAASCSIQNWRGFWRDEIPSFPENLKRFKTDDPMEIDPRVTPGPFATPPLQPANSNSNANLQPEEEEDDTEKQLLAGWYISTLQMIRLLVRGGRESKIRMDAMIDRCSHISNLRTEVFKCRSKAINTREVSFAKLAVSQASVAMQRYLLLILFDHYLTERLHHPTRQYSHPSSSPAGSTYMKHAVDDDGSSIFGSTTDLTSLKGIRTPIPLQHTNSTSKEMGDVNFHLQDSSHPTFEEWITSRKEIRALLRSVQEQPMLSLEAPGFKDLDSASSSESRKVITARRGVMLNTDTILKLDNYDPENSYNFRRVAGMRVYGVATLPTTDIKNLVLLIQTTHGAKNLMFLNLREEPFVFVNGKPYVLRNVNRPFRNLESFVDIDPSRLEKAEESIKKEIQVEASRYGGKVLVHSETNEGSLKVVWEEIEDDEAVQTPREVFDKYVRDGLPVNYRRIPMTPEAEPGLSDIDDIFKTIRDTKKDPGTHYIFFCQRGRSRSTIATILACLELDEVLTTTDESESLSVLPGYLGGASTNEAMTEQIESNLNVNQQRDEEIFPEAQVEPPLDITSAETDFPPLLSLIRVLPHGVVAKRWLDGIIDRCGQIFNLRKNTFSLSLQAMSAHSEEQSTALVENALFDLRRYFILLEAAGYCMERKWNSIATPKSFKQWCESRPELVTLKEEIHDKSALSLFDQHQQMATDSITEDRRSVFSRNGRVLIRGSILKTDHFPGCRRLPEPQIEFEGAPNFRSVWPEGNSDEIDLRVYGTGIPTESALIEIFNHLVGKEKEQVIWINLREEPILYVNGRPFVLRRLDEPFANLEHTGISRGRVEEMETRFKEDVLLEAQMHDNVSVLIHEEDETGGLTPKWEKVDSVLTPMELFEKMKTQFDLKYFRIPITDEQSPKPSAFDAILEIVANTKNSAHIVFNCQMGRGRTTTGLIVGCATRLRKMGQLRRFAQVVDNKIAPRRKFRSKIRSNTIQGLSSDMVAELKGDYLAITSQVRMMDEGYDAKREMDAFNDICDAMQNLREAIHEVKSRANKVDITPGVRAEALGVAEHYLRRYASLIQFTSYLMLLPDLSIAKKQKFSSFLRSRPELGNAWKTLSIDGTKSLLSTH